MKKNKKLFALLCAALMCMMPVSVSAEENTGSQPAGADASRQEQGAAYTVGEDTPLSSAGILAENGNEIVSIDDTDPMISYYGWRGDGAVHTSMVPGATASFTFTGKAIMWMGPKGPDMGQAKIYIDGEYIETVDCYAEQYVEQQNLFALGILSGEHIIKIEATSRKPVSIDMFMYAACQYYAFIKNGDFEAGEAGWASSGDVDVNAESPHTGKLAGRLLPGSRAEQTITLAPNGKYLLQAWVKSTSADTIMTLGVKGLGHDDSYTTCSNKEYTRISYLFEIADEMPVVTISARCLEKGSGYGFIDDISIIILKDDDTYQPLANADAPEKIPTYEGSGQVTHPSVLYFENGWGKGKYEYWMAMTPYPWNSGWDENPSIVASHDGVNWEVPEGVKNPLVPRPAVGHNCDVDLVYHPATGELWMYYVEADDQKMSWVKVLTSRDGVNWTGPETVIADETCMYGILSPSIELLPNGTHMMWYVNTGNAGWCGQENKVEYRTSHDGKTWSAAKPCGFIQQGYQPWHIDVHFNEKTGEFRAVYPAYPDGTNCDNTELFFATSKDGIQWHTFSKPIIKAGATGAFDDFCIYRSSLLENVPTGTMRVWYGAKKREDSSWNTGYSERNEIDFRSALLG